MRIIYCFDLIILHFTIHLINFMSPFNLFLETKPQVSIELNLGDVINPDRQINLNCDRIDFLLTFFNLI